MDIALGGFNIGLQVVYWVVIVQVYKGLSSLGPLQGRYLFGKLALGRFNIV